MLLVRVLQESLDIQLWSSHVSAFLCSTLFTFLQRALIYSCTALTFLLSNAKPCSCFAREPWHAAMELSLPYFWMLNLVYSWYPTAVELSFHLFHFVHILWQSALAQSCRPSFVFILHKPKSTSGVFCRLGDNSNISFTKSSGKQADNGLTTVLLLATACWRNDRTNAGTGPTSVVFMEAIKSSQRRTGQEKQIENLLAC